MRLLWLKTELLHPVDKGGKIRTYHMLKQLKRDHEITYLTLVDGSECEDALERASEYCTRAITVPGYQSRKFTARFYRDLLVNLSSPLPYAIEKYRSFGMNREIEREMSKRAYDAVICDFLAPSINFRGDANIASILFQHNVESMIWRRHFETQKNPIKSAFLRSQWRKMLAYEGAACSRFDAVVAVSEVDRAKMLNEFAVNRVFAVPTGVDTSFFCPAGINPNPRELVFTGSMDWLPNEDAVLYFADRILPALSAEIPGVSLTVAGRNPGPALLRLARANPLIKVVGRVDDIRPYLERAAVFVVPLRIGGGTRLKIFEAMAMEKPVVSTAVGAEGLPVADGKDLLIADSPEEFASAVIRLLGDAVFATALGEQARATVCQQFGWERAASSFAEICEDVVVRKTRRNAA